MAGCSGLGPDLDDASGEAGAESEADALALGAGMEFGLLFTGPGGVVSRSSVNPDEPGGGRAIAVDAVRPGQELTVRWRQTIEREVAPTTTTDVGVGTTTPPPSVEVVEQTGTITATGLADAHTSLLPLYWEPGERTTTSSLMWLSQEAFQELRDTRQTAWSSDPLTQISWVGEEVKERINRSVSEMEEVLLEAEADFISYELTVDGQQTTLQAVNAHDSFGNQYVILHNEQNPLVVNFRYNAVSVGFTGFDTALWALIKSVFSGYRILTLDTP